MPPPAPPQPLWATLPQYLLVEVLNKGLQQHCWLDQRLLSRYLVLLCLSFVLLCLFLCSCVFRLCSCELCLCSCQAPSQVVRGPKLAPAGRQEILTGLRKEVVTMGSTSTLGSVTTLGNRQPDGLAQRGGKQEIVTAPRQVVLDKGLEKKMFELFQVFYTSGTRPAGQTIHTLVNTSQGPVCKRLTQLCGLNINQTRC